MKRLHIITLAVLAASVLFAGPLAPRLRDWAAK